MYEESSRYDDRFNGVERNDRVHIFHVSISPEGEITM
jgi:hypothetical protein